MAEGKQFEIGAIIKLDGEQQFKGAVTAVNKNLAAMKAELNLVKEQYDGQANGLEALNKKQKIYADIVEAQKKKVDKTREGLENARKVYSKFGNDLGKASEALEKAESKLDAMRNASDTSAEALGQQEKEVERLQKALERGNENYTKQAGRISDWETKLKNAETQVIKANKQLDTNTKYLKEAENATDKCATSIDGYGKKVKEATPATIKWGEALKTGIAGTAVDAAVDALSTLGSATVGAAMELEQAGNQIEASTELSGAALDRYKGVLEDVYGNNYGDSLEDVSQSISKITHNMGELDDATLQTVTESAYALQDVFGMDLDETLRGAENLMYQFGMSADEAFDMLGAGAKSGLNYTDELGDNVSEYAGNFAQAGYSASEYFQLLKNGTENGSYNLDKVNDAINEVTNKLADGSVEKSLSIYSTETQSLFAAWQNGGATQKQVIDSIVADINNCTNQQDALTMSATAFGTMGEDSNLRFVQSLTSMGDAFSDTKGKMDEIKNVKYDDLNSQITEVARTLQMQLGKQLQKLLPVAANGLKGLSDNLELIESTALGLGVTLGLIKLFKANFFKNAIAGVVAYTTAVKGKTLAEKASEIATKALNLVMSLSPWTIAAVAIGAVTTALTFYALSSEAAKTDTEKQADEVRALADEMTALKEKTEESQKAFGDSMASAEAESGSLQVMSDRLYALAASEDMSNGKKAEMKMLVDQLNEAMPDLNLLFDEQTGKLNKNKEATDGYIASMREAAVNDVFADRMKEIATEIAEANAKIIEAGERKKVADTRLKTVEEERNKLLAENEDQTGVVSAVIGALNTEEDVLKGTINGCNQEIENGNKIVSEQAAKQEELGEQIKKTSGDMGILTKETEQNTAAEEANTQAAKAAAEAQKEALESLRSKYEEVKSSIQQSIEQKINLFAAFDGGDETSLDDMLANLDSQLAGLTNWKSNMEQLAGEVGKTIGPELYNHLVELGPGAANAVQELIDALNTGGEEGQQKLRELSEKYALELDLGDEISGSMAANKMILQAALGEMSSASEVDFSNLRTSIDEAVASAAEGWEGLPQKTRSELDQAVEAAKRSGAQIPQGLADAIRSGQISPADAIAQLNGSVQAQFDFLAEMAAAAGITIPDDIQRGILAGGDEAVQAIAKLNQLLTQEQGKTEKPSEESGKKSTKAVGRGVESAAGEVISKTGNVVQQGVAVAGSYSNSFKDVGYNLMSGLSIGLNSGSGLVYDKVRAIMAQAKTEADKATDSHSPSRVWRNQVGRMMSDGLALGIGDGIKGAEAKAVELARAALHATQGELGIQSPSKIFKKFGEFVSEGFGVGIINKKGQAVKASKELAKDVYKASSAWLEDYKKTHSLSLQAEKKFWQALASVVAKNTKAHKAAMKNAAAYDGFEKEVQKRVSAGFDISETTKQGKKTVKKEAGKYYGEILAAAKTYLDNAKADRKVSLQEEKYYWEQVKGSLKKGTKAYADAGKKLKDTNEDIRKNIKDNEKKIEEAAAKETKLAENEISRLENQIQNKKKYANLTAAEETAMWDKLLAEAEKKGGKYYKIVKKQAEAAKNEIAQANKEFGLSGAGLDMYKTYHEVSSAAEVKYWDIVRRQFTAGTKERIEADKKYLDAKKEHENQKKELDEDYREKYKDITDKLADDINDLTEAYNNAFDDRKDAIKSSFGVFDAFESEAEAPEVLLANMQSQVDGYALWMQQLQELSGKGLNDKFMEELELMGPEAAATILSLNMMTEEQLRLANEAWLKKDELAEAQAEKELESLKKETEDKIKAQEEAAKKQIEAAKAEYEKATAALTAAISAPLQNLANQATTLGEEATASLVMGVKAQAKTANTTDTLKSATDDIKKELQKLKKAGKTIGKDTLAGILEGLTDRMKIEKGAKSLVKQIEDAIKKAAGINSPSKRFRDSIGIQIPAGVAKGVEDGSEQAAAAGTGMIKKMLEKSKEQARIQQETLSGYLSQTNGGARIAALNALVETPVIPAPSVTVNNTEVAGLVSQMAGFMQEMSREMQNLKVVLDTGVLVGEISPAVGNELAAITRRWTR